MASGKTDEAYATLQRVARENGKVMLKGKLVENSNQNVSFELIAGNFYERFSQNNEDTLRTCSLKN